MKTVENFYEHLADKSPEGISYSEAIQICFRLFCTLCDLPEEYRGLPLSREELARIFARLRMAGLVTGQPTYCSPLDPCAWEHWSEAILYLLRNPHLVDDSIEDRMSSYV